MFSWNNRVWDLLFRHRLGISFALLRSWRIWIWMRSSRVVHVSSEKSAQKRGNILWNIKWPTWQAIVCFLKNRADFSSRSLCSKVLSTPKMSCKYDLISSRLRFCKQQVLKKLEYVYYIKDWSSSAFYPQLIKFQYDVFLCFILEINACKLQKIWQIAQKIVGI